MQYASLDLTLRIRGIYSGYARFAELILAMAMGIVLSSSVGISALIAVLPIVDLMLSAIDVTLIPSYFEWAVYLTIGLATVLVSATLLPVLVAFTRSLQADSMPAILIALIGTPAAGALFIWIESSQDRPNIPTIWGIGSSFSVLTLLVLLHLMGATTLRHFHKTVRLSASIPKSHVADLFPLAILRTQDKRRAFRAGVLRTVSILAIKSLVFIALYMLMKHLVFESESASHVDATQLRIQITLACFLLTLATLRTLIDITKRSHLLTLNILMLIFLADKTLTFFMPIEIAGDLLSLSGAMLLVLMREWLFAPLVELRTLVLHLCKRTAAIDIHNRGISPILFLRSFHDDHLSLSSTDRVFDFIFGGSSTGRRLEEVVVETLITLGPIVALENPAMPGRFLKGAARDSTVNSDWKRRIADYIESSQLIVVVLGDTDGLKWEMQEIVERNGLSKTLFVIPPDCAPSKLAAIDEIARCVNSLRRPEQTSLCVLSFIGMPEPYCYAVGHRESSERAYVEALRVTAGKILESLPLRVAVRPRAFEA